MAQLLGTMLCFRHKTTRFDFSKPALDTLSHNHRRMRPQRHILNDSSGPLSNHGFLGSSKVQTILKAKGSNPSTLKFETLYFCNNSPKILNKTNWNFITLVTPGFNKRQLASSLLLLPVGHVGARVELGQMVVLGRHDCAGDQQSSAEKNADSY